MARAKTRTRRKPVSKADDWPQYSLRFNQEEMHTKLKIDKHGLDDEIEQQPEIFGEVSEAAGMAKSIVESLEEQMKVLESELDAQFRADAEASEDKITEGMVKAFVAGNERRKALVIKILKAKHDQRQLDALSVSFKQRGYALNNMVDLYMSSYFSSRSAGSARQHHDDVEVDRIQRNLADRRETRSKRRRKKIHE